MMRYSYLTNSIEEKNKTKNILARDFLRELDRESKEIKARERFQLEELLRESGISIEDEEDIDMNKVKSNYLGLTDDERRVSVVCNESICGMNSIYYII
jgi:hypothetical protein